MRVTIDLDSLKAIDFFKTLFKGWFFLHRLPSLVRRTRKGFHIIYRGTHFDDNTIYIFRKILGDDTNRIELDMCSKKRIKQVLFYKKRVRFK